MIFICDRCKRVFQTQQELDEHERIYFYVDGMNAKAAHNLAELEETVVYLYGARKREQESNRTIWKYYSELERKYLQLLGVLGKHTDSNGKPDSVMNALYKQEAKDKQTVFEPVNKLGELLLLLQTSQPKEGVEKLE
jgi:hypothetical protein